MIIEEISDCIDSGCNFFIFENKTYMTLPNTNPLDNYFSIYLATDIIQKVKNIKSVFIKSKQKQSVTLLPNQRDIIFQYVLEDFQKELF